MALGEIECRVQLRYGGTQVHRKTLGDVIGARARSRLFEMCRVVRMPAVEDYRVKRAR